MYLSMLCVGFMVMTGERKALKEKKKTILKCVWAERVQSRHEPTTVNSRPMLKRNNEPGGIKSGTLNGAKENFT